MANLESYAFPCGYWFGATQETAAGWKAEHFAECGVCSKCIIDGTAHYALIKEPKLDSTWRGLKTDG